MFFNKFKNMKKENQNWKHKIEYEKDFEQTKKSLSKYVTEVETNVYKNMLDGTMTMLQVYREMNADYAKIIGDYQKRAEEDRQEIKDLKEKVKQFKSLTKLNDNEYIYKYRCSNCGERWIEKEFYIEASCPKCARLVSRPFEISSFLQKD